MLARMLLALFFLSCLWLEIRSHGSRNAPAIKPLSQAEMNLPSDPAGEMSDAMSAQASASRAQGGSLLTEAVHWVYLAYNDKGASAKADQGNRQ